MRAQGLLEQLTGELAQTLPAELSPVITDGKVKQSAILIITAFLNPGGLAVNSNSFYSQVINPLAV